MLSFFKTSFRTSPNSPNSNQQTKNPLGKYGGRITLQKLNSVIEGGHTNVLTYYINTIKKKLNSDPKPKIASKYLEMLRGAHVYARTQREKSQEDDENFMEISLKEAIDAILDDFPYLNTGNTETASHFSWQLASQSRQEGDNSNSTILNNGYHPL